MQRRFMIIERRIKRKSKEDTELRGSSTNDVLATFTQRTSSAQ